MKRLISAAAGAALLAGPALAQTQGVTDDEIVIGGHHDMSGIFAAFSVPAVTAANLYFDQVNASGGVYGRKIRYIVEDHGYQVPRAVQAANKLVKRDKIFAMLLALGTPHNLAAFKVQIPANVPNVSPLTSARQILDEPNDIKFAGTASYYDGIRDAVGYLAETNGRETVCSMYLPTDFGTEIQAASKDEAEAMGLTYAAETTHKPDDTDFSGSLLKLKDSGCDLVTIALGVKATITVVATARKLGWDDVDFLVSSAGFHTAVAKVPGGITEGLYAGAGWQDLDARKDDPAVAEFIKTYQDATGEFPGTGALLGHMAAVTFVKAVEAAGPDLTVESFVKGMESLDYDDPVSGSHVKYGPDDHVGIDDVFISQIRDGSWHLVSTVSGSD